MLIIKVCIFAIIGAFAIAVVKEQNKEVSVLLTVACSIGITFAIVEQFTVVIQNVKTTVTNLGINLSHIDIAVKAVCVAYFAQISIDLLEDMGSKSLADKISLCAKILIIGLSLPLIGEMIDIIGAIL